MDYYSQLNYCLDYYLNYCSGCYSCQNCYYYDDCLCDYLGFVVAAAVGAIDFDQIVGDDGAGVAAAESVPTVMVAKMDSFLVYTMSSYSATVDYGSCPPLN